MHLYYSIIYRYLFIIYRYIINKYRYQIYLYLCRILILTNKTPLIMPAITFIKKEDNPFNQQLKLFVRKIDEFTISLELTTAEIDSIKADSKFLDYTMKYIDRARAFTKSLTELKKEARKGYKKNIGIDLTFPELLDMGTPPPSVKPNIQYRFSKLVKRIKSHKKYNSVIGESLGIIAIQPHFDIQEGKPKLTNWHGEGVHPKIKYKKGKYHGAQIWKDEGKGYFLLATITRNNLIDESVLPEGETSAVWKYKAIYLYKDKQVGIWSDVMTITVSLLPKK